MASVGLDLLQARAQVIVDGSFAGNPLFTALLAALRPDQPVLVPTERRAGTALGAALLVGWTERTAPAPLPLRSVAPAAIAGLATYALDWRAATDAIAPAAASGGPGS
jgi:sugar (pentulose or hexulose) kinase